VSAEQTGIAVPCLVCGPGAPCALDPATVVSTADKARLDAARALLAANVADHAATLESLAPLRDQGVAGQWVNAYFHATRAARSIRDEATAHAVQAQIGAAAEALADAYDLLPERESS
jgi:hypothetical protein